MALPFVAAQIAQHVAVLCGLHAFCNHLDLQALRRFKLDTLKIDQSFVRGMSSNTVDLSIVNAIIALAQSLKIKVVAEGVETHEHRDMLRDLRCDEWQGHLICEPLPAGEFEQRFLATSAISRLNSG